MTDHDRQARAATRNRHPVEQFEARGVAALAPIRDHPVTKAIGTLAGILDQPPMSALCAGVIARGIMRGDRQLAATGIRMFAAFGVATAIKTLVKDNIDRSRPRTLIDDGEYALEPGTSEESDFRSFPSGHTAGGVAAARALGRAYPAAAVPAGVTMAVLAAALVPRQAHYPTDIAAGAAIGWLSERIVNAAWPAAVAATPSNVVSLGRKPH